MLGAVSEVPGIDREIVAEIQFLRGGGRTFLARQHVPYPFHITKPHRLDPDFPELATLCLQSASGGLYRGDRLRLRVANGPGAAARVVSQAATVVHSANRSISVHTDLTLAENSALNFFADPYVLFPGTSLEVVSEIVIDPTAFAVVAEGFDRHDPDPGDRPFTQLRNRTCVRAPCGRLLADDELELCGVDAESGTGPLGPYRAFGSVLVLGRSAKLDFAALRTLLDASAVLWGAGELPNRAGLQIRLLAADGGRLARGMRSVFAEAFRQRFGVAAARIRR